MVGSSQVLIIRPSLPIMSHEGNKIWSLLMGGSELEDIDRCLWAVETKEEK